MGRGGSLISLIPASVVESHLVIPLDEHERDGRVAQRPRQVAEMTGGVRLRAPVLAQGGVARSHLDPVSVHRLNEPASRQRDDPPQGGRQAPEPRGAAEVARRAALRRTIGVSNGATLFTA
jgi:hypothetical protein